MLVEDRRGIGVGFPRAEGEEDGHRGRVEMRTVPGQPDDNGCVWPIGEESMDEDALLDVLGETDPD